jgi:hypothetical protein
MKKPIAVSWVDRQKEIYKLGMCFSYWTVVGEPISINYKTNIPCRCVCGTEKLVGHRSLKLGRSKSCGCFRKKELSRTRTGHGMSSSKIYQVWAGMIQRCTNPKHKSWNRYGGRGISVDQSWLDANNFISWALENGYIDGLELDRIDNDNLYSQSNCRFVTHKENCQNRFYKNDTTINEFCAR